MRFTWPRHLSTRPHGRTKTPVGEVASNKDRLQRFTQEARTVSSQSPKHSDCLRVWTNRVHQLYCYRVHRRLNSSPALLATAYAYLAVYGSAPAKEVFPKAREYANKALELDSSLPDPHLSLGMMAFLWDRDVATWEQENRKALELNPNSTDAHRLEAMRFLFLGKPDEAIAEVRRALDIEPLSLAGNITYAYGMFYSGRIDESEAHTRKTIELAPEFWMSYYYLFAVYRYQRMYPEAVAAIARSKEYWGEPEAAKLIRETFAKRGWQGLLRAICAQPQQYRFYQYDLATFYAELGDKENAFIRLNQSLEDREQYIGFIKLDPFMNPLREDPRFHEIVKRLGLPE